MGPLKEQAASSVTLVFQLDKAQSQPGECLRVVGSGVELGSWNPSESVALSTDSESYPQWRSKEVVLRATPEKSGQHSLLQFKYVIDRRGLGKDFVWEDGDNRQVSIPWDDSDGGAVWLVRDIAFNVPSQPKLERLSPLHREVTGDFPERQDAPENTPECLFDAKTGTLGVSSALMASLRKGHQFDAKYALLGSSPMAVGGFSSVWRCRPHSPGPGGKQKDFAVKRVDTTKLGQRERRFLFGQANSVGEIKMHQLLHHPHVVQLVEAFHDSSTEMVSLVMEYCRGGDLLEIILEHRGRYDSGLKESAVTSVSRQLLTALAFLHGQGIVHRDVKCENIFQLEARGECPIENATFKLGDFGLAACVMPDEVLMEQVGSPSTSAPEVVQARPYGKPADIWSAGAAIFTALVASRPFEASTYSQMLANSSKDRPFLFVGDRWESTSEAARDFVRALLQRDAEKRPTACIAMQHPWLKPTPGRRRLETCPF
mmetsp:Transcript_90743/g.163810  ORF Transcript_90743/g.163810 Transcript_90743/m.163810 type:complete len:486 (-) Transcript_90743:161-1618(-)|eukprot:CAMPEP_0115075402 /NCGR_PEP_ID=MMETSP0227-20121206/15851_1 /TAXON_ID=89957 /ORGANISM="Polarella glacialis, Strain CCMP 1383" /LENGTH=485 /DNA_ID=CAMNT_0002462427 /DNA_START=94 /DNA_END=1551 /DNA_ORIENTATION=+